MSSRSNNTTERIESNLIPRRNRLLEFDQFPIQIEDSRVRDRSNPERSIILSQITISFENLFDGRRSEKTYDLLSHNSKFHLDDETRHGRFSAQTRSRFDTSFRSLFVENFRIVTVEREATVGVV